MSYDPFLLKEKTKRTKVEKKKKDEPVPGLGVILLTPTPAASSQARCALGMGMKKNKTYTRDWFIFFLFFPILEITLGALQRPKNILVLFVPYVFSVLCFG